MTRLLFAAVFALVAFVPAKVALAGGPGVPPGYWCEVEPRTESEGWMWFKRGKCPIEKNGVILQLKPNGDYRLYKNKDEHEFLCKVDAKSYFKGWADYACKDIFGNVRTHNQKFVTADGQLGLNFGK